MKTYQDFAKRKYSMRQRIITLAIAGLFFLLILPFLLVTSSAKLDQRFGLPNFNTGAATIIPGILLVVGGIFLGWWSIYAEITIGSGTPLPMMPTQKLVVNPPFTYCRNPMTLGTFIAYLGIGVWIGSFSAIMIVILVTVLLLLYVKFIEEKELAVRFGEDYLEYKKNTPFLLPRLRRRT